MIIGKKEFQTPGHTYVMGILNITPDSFSDGGKWNDRDRALRHVEEMIEAGADLIDIGGESTRPGYTLLPVEEEIERVVPVIKAVKAAFDVPVSLDTYKPEVALAGISAGADMMNDIWGLKYDSRMGKIIAGSGLPCCLMHNRREAKYEDFLPEVLSDLKETLTLAEEAGISGEKIILDPGVGFGKTYEQNLEVIRGLGELRQLNCPLLLGCSRKSVIGLTLDLPVEQRLEGTLVTTVMAVLSGCMFVRVHDVKENVRAIKMAEAILHG
ncbi:MAG: dihydropteroate synthase [Lachnospiraceae bacterium]|nr:dihydropteroate synthase [uncultured Acetatifactor sp.]MCI8286613.1 dihydropteroate synthase [Lachnospiraceae bacterium]